MQRILIEFDINLMELINTLQGHKDRVWCVDFYKSGNLLASCSSDKTIIIWDI